MVTAAVTGSALMTVSTIGYLVSSGGDVNKLESNVREAQDKARKEWVLFRDRLQTARVWMAKVVDGRNPSVDGARERKSEETAEDLLAISDGTLQGDTGGANEDSSTDRATQKEAAAPQRREPIMQSRSPWRNCHTCSGPRFWFFAEKLRLKRRIGPPSQLDDDNSVPISKPH